MTKRVARAYLGGPDVFWIDSRERGEALKAICREAGIEGVFPIDGSLDVSRLARREQATRIKRKNVALILGCDLMLANMEPWRGPGMDGGTAWEMGFAEALGLAVFGYTADQRPYRERVVDARLVQGMLLDGDGRIVEDFDAIDNLMMAAPPTPLHGSARDAAHAAAGWWAALAEDDPRVLRAAEVKRLVSTGLEA